MPTHCVLRARPNHDRAAVRDAGRLFERAAQKRKDRIGIGIGSFVFGAAELGGGIALLAATDDSGLHWLGRRSHRRGIALGDLQASDALVRSEDERMADYLEKQARHFV